MAVTITTGVRRKAPRILIYGPPKIGKTTFASKADGALFLPTEEGLALLDAQVVAGPGGKLDSWGEFHEALDAAEKSDARTIVVDTVTGLQDLCFGEVAREDRAPSIADIGYGKGYPRALTKWLAMLGRLDYLRALNKVIVMLGHAQVESFQDPEGEPYDRYSVRLHQQVEGKPSLRATTLEWADIIGFAAQQTWKKEIGKGFDARTVAGGTGKRVIYLTPSPVRVAGSRIPGLPPEIDLDWQTFWGHVVTAYRAVKPTPQTTPAPEPAPEPQPSEGAGGEPERNEQPEPAVEQESKPATLGDDLNTLSDSLITNNQNAS